MKKTFGRRKFTSTSLKLAALVVARMYGQDLMRLFLPNTFLAIQTWL